MAYENYGAYSTYQVPVFGNVIPIRRKPISGPFIMGYAAAPAGRAEGRLQSSAGMGYFGAPAGLAEAAFRGRLRSSAGMGYFGAPAGDLIAARTRAPGPGAPRSRYFGSPAGAVTRPAGLVGMTGQTGIQSGDIDPSTGHPWGEINPATGTFWPPLSGGGSAGGGGGGTDYAGIAQLITALGTVGLAGVNTILTQMNHDQLMQAQRDAQALAASGRAADAANAATINAAVMRALSAQSGNQPSQGMSTNTMLIVVGAALVGVYFLTQGKRRHNPVIGRGRRRRYVKSRR